jgi:hypothetical protein
VTLARRYGIVWSRRRMQFNITPEEVERRSFELKVKYEAYKERVQARKTVTVVPQLLGFACPVPAASLAPARGCWCQETVSAGPCCGVFAHVPLPLPCHHHRHLHTPLAFRHNSMCVCCPVLCQLAKNLMALNKSVVEFEEQLSASRRNFALQIEDIFGQRLVCV